MTLLPMGSATKFRCFWDVVLDTNRRVTNLLSSTSPIPARRDDIVVLGQALVEVSLAGGSHTGPVVLDSRWRQDRDGNNKKINFLTTVLVSECNLKNKNDPVTNLTSL